MAEEIEEPKKSAEWLTWIDQRKKYFQSYFESCRNIDRIYANLNDLRDAATGTSLGLLWANEQIQRPSIYAKAPVPAVMPRFKDRRPLYRVSSEVLERVASTQFDLSDVDGLMLLLRDDLSLSGRGVAWVRYDEGEICLDHIDREDFLCDEAKRWQDVQRVARCGWMTHSEMADRFGRDVADSVAYSVRDQSHAMNIIASDDEYCPVWEIWDKKSERVVWVAEGVEDVLDEGEPPIKVEGFFPCPKPAFGTLQPRTLIPIPDFLQYRQQNADIQILTQRISALMNGLKMKGFYQGGGETGDALERAMTAEDDGRLMVPISSLAAFGSGGDLIVWLPIDQVAQTLTACVELRRQLIEDVYQVTGISDIMRGATDPRETKGAQDIKQQNGSIRVRDKQKELVRIARDICRICAEIIAEEYSDDQIEDMSQMELPYKRDIEKQKRDLTKQRDAMQADMQRVQTDPAIQAQIQQNPEAAQQAIQQFEQQMQGIAGQIEELEETVTWEDVIDFLRDNKLRPFVLDIETDSTIYPDEQAEKQSRAEFLSVVMGVLPQAAQLASLGPQAVALAGGIIKFAVAPYRVGRELDGLIDDFVDSAPQMAEAMQAQQGGGEDQEAMAQIAEAEKVKAQAQMAKVEADSAAKSAELQQRELQMMVDTQEKQAKMQIENQKLSQKNDELAMKNEKIQAEIDNIRADTMKKMTEAGLMVQDAQLREFESLKGIEIQERDQALGQQNRAEDMAVAERDKQVDTTLRVRDSERAAQMGDRQQSLAEKQAESK